MLKLKRVELHGFKSFADKSEMRFNGFGIAAVVGPNGCGKSNLSDAISWVLGEQSAKSLRGANMQDVIFAGTKDRKPLGMAAVTLTLVDPRQEDTAPADGAEKPDEGGLPIHKLRDITITRRLFRNGQSEYLINGKQARLRDIQDLFMGSGLGPESYAIIEQGRIGQILSTKPQDRRSVIEEAAGITRFKTKRRLSEAKLDGAKQNLTRVYDILEEVSRQVNSLKRQAAKTKRYEELRAELVTHLKVALTGRYRVLEREAAKVALDLNQSTARFQVLQAQVTEKEKAQAELQERCYATEQELREGRKRLADLRVEAERTRSRFERQSEQAESIGQRLQSHGQEVEMLSERLTALEQELREHHSALAVVEEQLQQYRGKAQQVEADRNRLANEARQREQAIEQARQQSLRLLGEANSLRNQLAQANEYLQSVDRDLARSGREQEAAQGDAARLNQSKAELQEQLAQRQMALQNVTEQRKDTEQDLTGKRQEIAESRRALDHIRSEANRLKARKESLEDILNHHSYTTGSVKRLFTAVEKNQAQGLRIKGTLADYLEVEKEYEKATEEFLHEELEYVVVPDWEQAQRGIDLLRTSLDGRATFLVHAAAASEAAAAGDDPIRREEGVVAKLSEVLRLTNGFSAAALAQLPRLGACYVVADHATAQRLAPRFAHAWFLLADGISYHGLSVTGGKKSGSGPLALKRELRELAEAWQVKQAEAERKAHQVDYLEGEIAEIQESLERLRGLQQAQERDTHALNVEMRKIGEEMTRANSRLSVAKIEIDRLNQQRLRSEEARDRNQALLEQKDHQRQAAEAAMEEGRAALQQAQSQLARFTEEHSTLRVELAGLEERRRAAHATKARLEQQGREMGGRRHQLQQEMERLTQTRANLVRDNGELAAVTGRLQQEIQQLDRGVAMLAEREEQERGSLHLADEKLRQLRAEFQTVQEAKNQSEVTLVRCQSELKFLDETCQKELQLPLAELAQQADETIPSEEVLQESQRKYQEVRQKIDNLGPVNPAALEEFEEAQQRYDFLSAQRQDLLDSIRDTEKAIQEIDLECRKRFTDAFEAVNASFKQMFVTLFGGGVGEMRLTEPDNPIESGIDIVAQPPSKKLQNVLLLSGGEKALTAMALLMAIFKYQPSPFCILDEVDAPLDEPNTERLTRLLKEMSAQTQFIVITHAKRTMESAQVMYGVTMQEPGVSKLVSVRFNAADAKPVPAPPKPPVAEAAAVM